MNVVTGQQINVDARIAAAMQNKVDTTDPRLIDATPPIRIEPNEVYIVPQNKQVVFAITITVDEFAVLLIDGILLEV